MKKFLAIFAILLLSALLASRSSAQNMDMNSIMQGLQSMNGAAPATQPHSANQFQTAMFMRMVDTDHNGTVSKAELAAMTNQMFDVADTNHDGQLSQQELSAFAANMTKVLSMMR